jgi:hypothetical protein
MRECAVFPHVCHLGVFGPAQTTFEAWPKNPVHLVPLLKMNINYLRIDFYYVFIFRYDQKEKDYCNAARPL